LLQSNCLTYLGAFALYDGVDPAIVGDGRFGYGGFGLQFYKDPVTGKNTLFLQGANNYGAGPNGLAQVEIPNTLVKSPNRSDLPLATILQKFVNVTGSSLPAGIGGTPADGAFIFGVLPFNNKLILGATMNYAYVQTKSHGVYSSTTLGSGSFSGWYTFNGGGAVDYPRAMGGQMSEIPAAWQSALGGAYFTGMQSVSVSPTTSCGPSLTVFNPQDILDGVEPIPGKTLLFYEGLQQLCNNGGSPCENIGDYIYSGLSKIRGRALVAGTKSILFFGFDGVNPGSYWYGNNPSPEGLFDPFGGGFGPHSTRYTYKVWAYNVNDLVAVKNGLKLEHEVRPYAVWTLDEIANYLVYLSLPEGGITHDPLTNRVYLASYYGETPRIDVYQITV
jgi:hypothetical protein